MAESPIIARYPIKPSHLFVNKFPSFAVSSSELKRIKQAFKRCTAVGSNSLSKSAFIHEVLGDGVPPVLAEWLYVACGGTSKGIPFRELLCGLVLLTKGTQDEKIK